MSENATPNDFTPGDALSALSEARAYEEPLRQRTEGLTWIIWGLVTPAIFLTYHAGALAWGNTWPWWGNLLWTPWIAAGCAATYALWHTAALTAPGLASETGGPGVILGSLGLALLILAWGVVLFKGLDLEPPTTMVIAVGSVWTVMAAANAWQGSRRGRRVGITIGGLYLVTGIVLAVLGATTATAAVVAEVAGGTIPLLGGLYQVHRG